MELAILARHAESEFSVRGAMNGDPATACPLTDEGRGQAARLGEVLLDQPLDLVVVTEFVRTAETADLALAGRDVPRLVVPELNDVRVGEFEGGPLETYRAWVRDRSPLAAPPGGGESRADVARRFAAGFRHVLARPERVVLVVTHGLPIRYVLLAAEGSGPRSVVENVEYAAPHRLSADELETAVDRLEAWSADPSWATPSTPKGS